METPLSFLAGSINRLARVPLGRRHNILEDPDRRDPRAPKTFLHGGKNSFLSSRMGSPATTPKMVEHVTPDGVFEDFLFRRTGLVSALTTE